MTDPTTASKPPVPQPQGGDVFRFGEFVLDADKCELRHAGQIRDVGAMVVDFLLFLVRERARVVEKQELLDRFWPDSVVGEGSLTQLVRRARHSVGDDGDRQTVIKTLRGRGFRFVAEVEPTGPIAPLVAPEPTHKSAPTFIGRAREIELLRKSFVEAKASKGSVVLLVGPAGIGKTSLAERLATLIGDEATVYWSRSVVHEGVPAFWPWIQVLRRLTKDRGTEAVAKLAGADVRVIARLLPDLGQYTASDGPAALLAHRDQETR